MKIIDDRDGDGFVDAGEPILNADVSDSGGAFNVQDIVPGLHRIMAVQPAELGGVWGAPAPLSLPADAGGKAGLGDKPFVRGNPVTLSGTVWNDVDGDALVDAGEPGLPNVELQIWGAVSGQAPAVGPLATARTNGSGGYQVNQLIAGYPYEVRPVAASVPAGWLMSSDASDLVSDPALNAVNVGYYNPFAPSPLRQSDWKKELKQAGKPRYTPAQVEEFIGKAESVSGVFPAVAGIRAVLTEGAVRGDQGQALKEYAALVLNRASGRLYAETPVTLSDPSIITTIGAVVAEIEGILVPGKTPTKDEYQRVRKLAETINAGKGLGYGKTGVFSPAQATYRGALVISKLRPAGDLVDLGTDAPVYLLKWSPGALNMAINVSEAKVSVKVKVFMDGGVLDVFQVRSDGSTELLDTAVPTVWNKDVNAIYTFDLRGVSTAEELVSTEIRLVARDASAGGKQAKVRVDSAELTFKY